MGMPLYGQSFTLNDKKVHGLNAPARQKGRAGDYTRAPGFLAYYEICHNIKKEKWTVVRDKNQSMGPYAYQGNQWVGFDDIETIRRKSQYIRDMGLGGGMVWALDLDDFKNRCGDGKHPLLNTIKDVLGPPRETVSEGTDNEISTTTEREDIDGEFLLETNTEEAEEVFEDITETILFNETSDDDTDNEDEEESLKVICYFTNWAWYRSDDGKYGPEHIQPGLCTHIVYGFAVLDPATLTMRVHDEWADLDNGLFCKNYLNLNIKHQFFRFLWQSYFVEE